MGFLFYVLLPLLLTAGVALATNSPLRAQEDWSLGRIGSVLLCIQIALAAAVVAVVVESIRDPRDERCGGASDDLGVAVLALIVLVAIVGGFVAATVVADARRQRGILVWHLLAAPAAAVVPYLVAPVFFFWALSCTS